MAFLTLWTFPPPNVIKKRLNSSSKNRTENKSLAKHQYLFEFASDKDDLNKRQTLTPVSLLLKPNISIWQLLICSPSSSSSFFFFLPLPLIYFSLTVLAAQSQIDFSLSTLALPSPKEGEEGGCVCVFSLKFLSQNYNTLKGETHRHEKAVPCPRGFLAISARAGGAVRLQQKAASLHSALHSIGLFT